MTKFSTVKKALDFLIKTTGQHWEAKYEIHHDGRFYFIWKAEIMPFNVYHRTLVCRGNKLQVLEKLNKLANSPSLPSLPTKTLYRQTVSAAIIAWDEPGENF